MDLSNLKPAKGAVKKNKRIGRGAGSGHGGTSTRGHKGAGSRSGNSRKIGFEGGQMPLQRRLPKFGFNSLSKRFHAEIRLSEINSIASDVIDLVVLKSADLIGQQIKFVKLIKSGKISRAITIKGLAVTKGAKDQIEAAGGKVEA